MKSDFLIAVTQLAAERHLPREAVISAIEAALASAYKKDSVLAGQEISVSLNPANGELKLFTHKTTVQKVEDHQREISLPNARKIQKDAVLGDVIGVESDIQNTGRIAAQTAKQVVLQRLREVERELVFQEFVQRTQELVSGVVDQIEAGRVIVFDLGRVNAILPPEEQVPTERYRKGQRQKIYVLDVSRTSKGPEILVSRSHKDLLKRLFELEVPEVFNGIIEIKSIAREPGSRSKVAVWAKQEGIDAVGSCVGLRGIRIQNIVNELQGEKIDVIGWDSDPAKYISNALSPADVGRVEMYQDDLSATAIVPQKQLSLAIGKEGQNARLAARLTGWKIDIKSHEEAMEQAGGELPNLIKDASKVVEEPPVSSVDSLQQESADQIKQQEVKEKPVFDKSVFEEEAKTKEEEGDVSDSSIELSEQSVEELARLSEDELAGITNTEVDKSKSEESESSAKPDLVAELPEDIWDISKTKSSNDGGLRFAEDIDELRRGTGTNQKRTKRKVKNTRKK